MFQDILMLAVQGKLGLDDPIGRYVEGVPGGDHVELADPQRFRYLRLEFKDDVVVGANSLGMTEHVGVMRNLVERGVRLGRWKEALKQDPTRLMEAYLASAQAQGEWQGRSRGSSR